MIARQQRLAYAMYEASEEDQQIRKTIFGEDNEDRLLQSIDYYNGLFASGYIDHQLFTTSARQGAVYFITLLVS